MAMITFLEWLKNLEVTSTFFSTYPPPDFPGMPTILEAYPVSATSVYLVWIAGGDVEDTAYFQIQYRYVQFDSFTINIHNCKHIFYYDIHLVGFTNELLQLHAVYNFVLLQRRGQTIYFLCFCDF